MVRFNSARLVLALLLANVPLSSGTMQPGRFLTSEAEVRTFPWGPASRTVAEAFDDAFDAEGDHQWVNITYTDSNDTITRESLIEWIESDLLNGPDPFAAHSGEVPVPWPAEEGTEDQLSHGAWVGYARRQVCFIVAQSLIGAETVGYANGLERYLNKTANSGCTPRLGHFGRAYFVLLAACNADPGLANGGMGPLLIAAKGMQPTAIDKVRRLSRGVDMEEAGLRVCEYDDGVQDLDLRGNGEPSLPNIPRVPAEGCADPTANGVGRDFMTGGLKGQAVQDISAAFLGGYVFGYDCGLGGGQDERLMTYMPEVGVLTFFLSESAYRGGDEHPHPQLRQPAWILGARQLFQGLDGTARFNTQLIRDPDTPLTSDLVGVQLDGTTYAISSSRPFLAFMSENQAFIEEGDGTTETREARQNKNPKQRRARAPENVQTGFANAGANNSFDREVRAWYSAVALSNYNEQVQPVLRSLVKSIGTGPWLAGLWWGDSQLGFLAVWLGQAIAAPTWGELTPGRNHLLVDYYLYSAFTENPGNQCLVRSGAQCMDCLQHCNDHPLPDSACWMPAWAQFNYTGMCSCVPAEEELCGRHGLEDVVDRWKDRSASDLWTAVERALNAQAMDKSVFDLMFMPPPTFEPTTTQQQPPTTTFNLEATDSAAALRVTTALVAAASAARFALGA
mmetsp:Transcript_31503/g.80314  ORF Transcript_31503/g.80314 Transcript_31503/m.80314 type:complete len:678 (+) Transcript_31503:64-2097(+)|eukprot:CAMPEP_0195082624 /NCGR_PEP_ID=MMETSP0448-20130528/23759_1 /TAXON_ID=66468 /ORGANISM="Heterocapsa triquestra, Strain CCMP 448" /LENGTH=677 /DNA_ID=CAMNT_0040115753 /DNA_START=62 /DNA_END=2095 /DNA_ORIENTATION=-